MESISTSQQIQKGKITKKESRKKAEIKYGKIQIDGKRLLMKTEGTSWGFRYEETKKGGSKYTLPMVVSEEFSKDLYAVAEKLGDEDYAPIYETDDGPLVYVRVVSIGYRPSYIHDRKRKKVNPSDKTSCYTKIRAVIEVDSLREGEDLDPKLQLSLYQAEVEDAELEEVEDLL